MLPSPPKKNGKKMEEGRLFTPGNVENLAKSIPLPILAKKILSSKNSTPGVTLYLMLSVMFRFLTTSISLFM
jgi:hypothetical protein